MEALHGTTATSATVRASPAGVARASSGGASHQWSTIQLCCNRWAGCVENIERAPPSGSTIEDRVKHYQVLYKQREPKHKTFVMHHCWSLLQHNEKWKQRKNDLDQVNKACNKSSIGLAQELEEDEGEEASHTVRSQAPTNKRPLGRREEKERIKKGGDHAVFQMMAARKELEAEKKQEKESRWMDIKAMEARKVAIEEGKLRILEEELQTKKMKQECEIMFMDIRGLDETQKAYVLAMHAQILESKMGRNGSGNAIL